MAIVDFDVHHGNGTEDIFQADATVLYASSHQMPLYPGTGDPSFAGVGNIVNAALPAGSGTGAMRRRMSSASCPPSKPSGRISCWFRPGSMLTIAIPLRVSTGGPKTLPG